MAAGKADVEVSGSRRGGAPGFGAEGRVLVDGGAAGRRWESLVARAVRRVLEAEDVADAHLSVALLDDDGMRRLNREHLGRDRPTDVIAFPLWEEGEGLVVGDVYVGLEQAERQAVDAGVALAEELVRLTVHGTLHVLGWQHPDGAEEREVSPMFRRQEELVQRMMDKERG